MSTRARTALWCLALLPLPACTAVATPTPTSPLPKVIVSMFSGRQDPSFTLTREQADALTACLADGTAAATGSPPEGLGFRYFTVAGLRAHPLLLGVDGAWSDEGGRVTPVALCAAGFAILRSAATAALDADVAAAIPKP
jgi:hypothetical protein